MSLASGAPGHLGEFGWGGAAGSLAVVDREHGFTLMLIQHMLGSLDAGLRWGTVPLARKAISDNAPS